MACPRCHLMRCKASNIELGPRRFHPFTMSQPKPSSIGKHICNLAEFLVSMDMHTRQETLKLFNDGDKLRMVFLEPRDNVREPTAYDVICVASLFERLGA